MKHSPEILLSLFKREKQRCRENAKKSHAQRFRILWIKKSQACSFLLLYSAKKPAGAYIYIVWGIYVKCRSALQLNWIQLQADSRVQNVLKLLSLKDQLSALKVHSFVLKNKRTTDKLLTPDAEHQAYGCQIDLNSKIFFGRKE